MPKFDKIVSPMAMAFVLVAAPVAVSAQVAPADATNPADPMVGPADPGLEPQTSAPAQPGTTDIPASEPAMQPQAQAEPDAMGDPQVEAFVSSQFAEADKNGDGVLTPDEFEPWMAELKAAESAAAGTPADTEEAQTYASNAFAAADLDGDGTVTVEELTQFFNQSQA